MKLNLPFLWLTQTANGVPEPWKYFDVEGIMLNAYEILKKPKIREKMEKYKIHRYLEFKGYITIDSGGFLFMKHNEVPLSPIELVEFYERLKPNFAVTLDHPIFPTLPKTIVRKRQEKSLENVKIMVETKGTRNPVLVPVIHGYDKSSLKWYISQLEKIGEFDIYGVGSLVPLARNTKGVKGGLYKIIDVIMAIKGIIPERKIHVFGVGSSLTMHLMFLAGADSVDSSSWRSKAAFGAIQLPGIGDRYITGKQKSKRYRNLSPEEIEIFNKYTCPICKEYGIKGLKEKFTLRAIHNAWIYQREIQKIREKMEEGSYEEYVKSILKNKPPYKLVLRYIYEKKKQKTLPVL
ncbi:tRNA-guanine transglycosylase [Thermococcus argininiproducens]|uniref:tRNA-guanine transglycosylase n=1 Tax=Thermococcus argininiproducens TaxID=2866384 RepID=A0A9E7SCQ5_9EURY|nr:tRNA-guanine transglycosylase [Thermococcus argininiproducens]USG99382.1 tRNA-guanine transglycosylase [Thermococcus argininiproducens]